MSDGNVIRLDFSKIIRLPALKFSIIVHLDYAEPYSASRFQCSALHAYCFMVSSTPAHIYHAYWGKYGRTLYPNF